MKNKVSESLIIVYSYHHKNTEKVAAVIANEINAEVKHPEDISFDELSNCDLVGFGAGIDSGKHYKPILKLADKLPAVENKKAFIFSTSGITGKSKMDSDHSALRKILLSKGYIIADEFQCRGFNTNSFLKFFGGMNKGRPDTDDLNDAAVFAKKLIN